MAEVKSFLRSFLKPILFKALNEKTFLWFQYRAKIRDINKNLVQESEEELLPFFVHQDSVCFDIGANYAYYTVPLARLCPEGTVYAFEPIPPTYRVCKKIIEHYHFKNVQLFQKGVGEKKAIMQFEAPLQSSGFISAGQAHMKGRHNELPEKRIYYPWNENRIYECEVISIDEEFPGLERLDFIKIDIEGAELFALKGMINTLKKFRPVILIEICKFWLQGFNVTANEISAFILDMEYDLYRYVKEDKRLVFVPSLADDELYNFVDTVHLTPFAPNYVLIPREQRQRYDAIIKGAKPSDHS